jgi:hypothetical protein
MAVIALVEIVGRQFKDFPSRRRVFGDVGPEKRFITTEIQMFFKIKVKIPPSSAFPPNENTYVEVKALNHPELVFLPTKFLSVLPKF